MKTCPKCSTELEDAVTSCVSCGFQLNRPERSLLGKAAKWGFIVFNVAMICWVLIAMGAFGLIGQASQEEALPHGTEDSAGMGLSMIVMIWVICNAVLGVIVWDTRARKRALQESHKQTEE